MLQIDLFIILQMLSEAQSRDDSQFVENTRGVVFYSTPHNGSNVAKLNKTTKMIFFPTTEVQDLEPDSPALQMLHQNFTDLVKTLKVCVFTHLTLKSNTYLYIVFVENRMWTQFWMLLLPDESDQFRRVREDPLLGNRPGSGLPGIGRSGVWRTPHHQRKPHEHL